MTAQRTHGMSKMRFPRLIGFTSAVASLVLMVAAPAHAIGANQGLANGGVGDEDSITLGGDFGNPPSVLCFQVHEQTNIVHWGNNDHPAFNATTTSPSASATYTKQTDLTWTVDDSTTGGQTMYINPDGIFSAPASPTGSGCDSSTLGDPIAATATVTGTNGGGSISCSSGLNGASYSRVGTDVTVSWTGTCTVKNDSGTPTATTPSVSHTFTATETPCITPPNSCLNSTFTSGHYDYS